MKNRIVPIVILSLFTSIGCNTDSNTGIQSAEAPPATIAPLPGNPNANQIPATTAPALPATITSKPVSTAALNPAHGQPGHRCDIAVGAPLDSKAAAQPAIQTQPATTTTPTLPATTTPTFLSTPTSAGTGLNPAHGQPGHRCDIAVGAPLNSKPAQ